MEKKLLILRCDFALFLNNLLFELLAARNNKSGLNRIKLTSYESEIFFLFLNKKVKNNFVCNLIINKNKNIWPKLKFLF